MFLLSYNKHEAWGTDFSFNMVVTELIKIIAKALQEEI